MIIPYAANMQSIKRATSARESRVEDEKFISEESSGSVACEIEKCVVVSQGNRIEEVSIPFIALELLHVCSKRQESQ